MKPLTAIVAALGGAALLFAGGAQAAEPPCEQVPRQACFGVESVDVSLSKTQAGDHPDLTLSFAIKKDPETPPNPFGLQSGYAATRNVRFELPPGLIGDPNVLGPPQQRTASQLATWDAPGGGCPAGSQIGRTQIHAYSLLIPFVEPVYMMTPPGGDVVARVGFIAGIFPTYIDFKVRSESDYGLVSEITDAPALVVLVKADTTIWGVPAAPSHDTERCTPGEAGSGQVVCESRPPGSTPRPFLTNPTRCGTPLEMRVAASSWAFPEVFDTASDAFPSISGCNRLPFGPSLSAQPTSRRAAAPTGLDMAIRLPGPDGVDVLEPSHMRDIRIGLPEGLSINPGAADGLDVCSASEVGFGTREEAHCPDAAKLASTEFDVPVTERRLKGAIYLREPQPGNLFRVWIVADDLGAHVKLPGQLEVDRSSGKISSVVLDVPQFPLREARLLIKSGFRAPLVNPSACGEYSTDYEFTPWSGTPAVLGGSKMRIDEGCEGLGGFSPKLTAGSTDLVAGRYSPFLFTLTRQDGEQNPARLDVSLPRGLSAKLAGVALCEGAATETGACPPASQIGVVKTAVGAGPAPLWVPQPGKRPTAIYLSGPYKGAPLSIVAVVPAQAGPFDLGDEVVRSAIRIDPQTAQATAQSDPLPQIIEGIPIKYRTVHVHLNRPEFTLNPTGCQRKAASALLTSTQGASANPSAPFRAVDCDSLGFKPKFSFHLLGGTRRGAHPRLRAVVRRVGKQEANFARASVALPRSAFLDQAHIKTVCTRVQFAAEACPSGSVYGRAVVKTPLFEEPLTGPVHLRSSSNPLPDLVIALRGPSRMPVKIELAGRIDSVDGAIRTTFSSTPDAPFSSLVLTMQGGRKGLLVNSRNLCASTNRATVEITAQNGKKKTLHPAVSPSCEQGKSP